MHNLLSFHIKSIDRLYLIPRPDINSLLLLDKLTVARWLYYAGILIAVYGTLNPWFLWPVSRYVHYLAFVPVTLAMMFSKNLKHGLFNRTDYVIPTLACVLLQLVMALTSGKNINGIVSVFFSSVVYMSLLKLDKEEVRRLGDMLATSLACILVVSIPFYILYLLGFSWSHVHVVPAEWDYSFENYWFFLLDDRSALDLVPRFHSVFLEPSHLGMACVAFLYAQIGKWDTWRCRILFFALLISFSLAGYICMVVMLFSSAWMKGRAIIGKILILLGVFSCIVVASIFYNKGDNIVNVLIVQRLTLNSKGEFEGDNRTKAVFTKEYEKMASSEEVFLGKGMEAMERFGSEGNSGYRVFLYTYGLVSVFFVILFFGTIFMTSDNFRAKAAMALISSMSFVAHGIPIKYYFFIPLFVLVFSDVYPRKQNKYTVPYGSS